MSRAVIRGTESSPPRPLSRARLGLGTGAGSATRHAALPCIPASDPFHASDPGIAVPNRPENCAMRAIRQGPGLVEIQNDAGRPPVRVAALRQDGASAPAVLLGVT